MALQFQQREKEGITILDLDGRLTAGDSATTLRERLRELANAGTREFLLNLAQLDYIDSTGLGTLVVCYTGVQKLGGHLKLLHLNRRNLELMLLTKLTTIFELFNDEQDAVNSFFPDRHIRRFDILSFVQDQRRNDD
jgi:anti-sigma B factor antagonist